MQVMSMGPCTSRCALHIRFGRADLVGDAFLVGDVFLRRIEGEVDTAACGAAEIMCVLLGHHGGTHNHTVVGP